jgi:hypothetical protein
MLLLIYQSRFGVLSNDIKIYLRKARKWPELFFRHAKMKKWYGIR